MDRARGERHVGVLNLPRHIGLVNFALVTALRMFDEQQKVGSLLTNLLLPYHPVTLIHSIEVGYFSCLIGEKMGLTESELTTLTRGGFLHDIGKRGVPLAILDKEGKLTESEWEKMALHDEIGTSILNESGLGQYTPFTQEHHIGNSNRSNEYRAKTRSLALTEITSIADMVAAIRDPRRSYHKKSNGHRLHTIKEVREIVKNNGFSRGVVGAFMEIPDGEVPFYTRWLIGSMIDFFEKYVGIETFRKIFSNRGVIELLGETE